MAQIIERKFATSYTKAVAYCKLMLRYCNKVKRLSSPLINETSTQCHCGETGAVTISTKINGQWHGEQVGICKCCANI